VGVAGTRVGVAVGGIDVGVGVGGTRLGRDFVGTGTGVIGEKTGGGVAVGKLIGGVVIPEITGTAVGLAVVGDGEAATGPSGVLVGTTTTEAPECATDGDLLAEAGAKSPANTTRIMTAAQATIMGFSKNRRKTPIIPSVEQTACQRVVGIHRPPGLGSSSGDTISLSQSIALPSPFATEKG
jgi:hypothetical protein